MTLTLPQERLDLLVVAIADLAGVGVGCKAAEESGLMGVLGQLEQMLQEHGLSQEFLIQ